MITGRGLRSPPPLEMVGPVPFPDSLYCEIDDFPAVFSGMQASGPRLGKVSTDQNKADQVAQPDSIVSGMAGRYASALYDLAREQNAVDTVREDMKSFAGLIQSSTDLQRLVESPVFTADEQLKALSAILDKAKLGGLSANFLKLVASKRRLFAIGKMIADFNALVDHDRGVARAEVTVAEPLSEAHMKTLREALKDVSGGQSVEVDVKVDPEIIGGIVVKIGSRMIDSSLKTKLNSIRSRMKEAG